MAAMRRIDHGHFAGSEEAFRHWDEDGEVPGSCSKCHSAAGLPSSLKEGVTISAASVQRPELRDLPQQSDRLHHLRIYAGTIPEWSDGFGERSAATCASTAIKAASLLSALIGDC